MGAPLEKVGTLQSAGAVTVFYASGGGVLSPGESWTQDSPGLGGTAEAFDFFGAALGVAAPRSGRGWPAEGSLAG